MYAKRKIKPVFLPIIDFFLSRYTNNKVIIRINQASNVILGKFKFIPISFISMFRFSIGILRSCIKDVIPSIPNTL